MELAHTTLAQLLAHIQLAYQDPPGPPLQSCLPDSWTPACPSLLHEVFPSQMQGLALALVLLHELLVNAFLWPIQVPLPSTPAILQCCAIHRLAESAVCHPGCQRRCWTASWTLHHRSQLSESWQSSQFSIHLLIHLSQTVSYQFGGKETMGDCAKGFPKMKMNNINCLPHIHWCQWPHHREQWGWSSVICLCLLLRQEMDSEEIWSTTFAGMQLRLACSSPGPAFCLSWRGLWQQLPSRHHKLFKKDRQQPRSDICQLHEDLWGCLPPGPMDLQVG